MKEVLVIAAHPDDEIIGVGGTVSRLAKEGKKVRALVLATGITSRLKMAQEEKELIDNLRSDARKSALQIGYSSIEFLNFPDNSMDSIPLLEIVKEIEKVLGHYEPDTVFTHFYGDLNIDHRIACEAVQVATRPKIHQSVKDIYSFEIVSSTDWFFTSNNGFKPNVFIDISEEIEQKKRALTYYNGEMQRFPEARSIEAIQSLNKFRGSTVGVNYAEAFQLIRSII